MSEKPNVSLDDYRAALVKCEALRTENSQLASQLKDSTEALSILIINNFSVASFEVYFWCDIRKAGFSVAVDGYVVCKHLGV